MITNRPDGPSSSERMRNARSRPFGATCIHTALSRIKSNRRPSARRFRRSGSASFIQTTRWCESRAARSRKALGSTATTSQPRAASQLESRPEPAPISQAKPGSEGRCAGASPRGPRQGPARRSARGRRPGYDHSKWPRSCRFDDQATIRFPAQEFDVIPSARDPPESDRSGACVHAAR